MGNKASSVTAAPKGMNFTTRKRIGSAVTSVVMILIALVCAVPLWYILINTFKTIPDMSANPLGLPKEWTIKNYINAFETVPVFRSLLNTLIVTFFAVVIQVLVGALAAYGMILRKSTFTAAVGAILMVAFVVPAQTTLIPLYRMEANAHLVNTLAGQSALLNIFQTALHSHTQFRILKIIPFSTRQNQRFNTLNQKNISFSIQRTVYKGCCRDHPSASAPHESPPLRFRHLSVQGFSGLCGWWTVCGQ